MKMSKWMLPVFSLLLGGVLAGCAAGSESREAAGRPMAVPEVLTPQAKQLAADYVDGFAAALRKRDFSELQKVIPPESREKITAKMFDAMEQAFSKNFGSFDGCSYLGVLDKSMVADYLWKFRFKKDAPGEDGAGVSVVREAVYLVRIGFDAKEKKPVIAGVGFFLID